MPRRGPRVLALLPVALLLLAGCSGPDASPTDAASKDTGSTSSATSGASGASTTGTGAAASKSTAALHGRIHDAANFSIAGARIDVLGSEARTTSASDGTYHLEGLRPGTATVRIESGGFLPVEVDVRLEAGKMTSQDVQLRPNPTFAPGMTAHVHDYWGTSTTRVLMDELVVVSETEIGVRKAGPDAFNRPNQGTEWEFYLPDSPDGLPSTVWPGTGKIRFTPTWDTAPENNVPAVGLYVLDAATAGPASSSPEVAGAVNLGSVPRGGTLEHVLTAGNQSDGGHALFTAWRFWMYIDNRVQDAPQYTPALALDGIHLRIEIEKGAVGLEPGHNDWWQGADQLVVGNPDWDYRPNQGVPPVSADAATVFSIAGGKDVIPVVPPGTNKLQIRFTWRLDQPLPFEYELTYRTADMNPRDTPRSEFKVPKRVEAGAAYRLYEIEVQPHEADPFYAQKSLWGLAWTERNASGVPQDYYVGGFFVHFDIELLAFRDPNF